MKVVRNKVVMAALMALLAIKGTSAALPAALPAAGTQKLLPSILGLGMLPSLPGMLPTLPSISTSGRCPTYPSLAGFTKTAFDGIWFVYQQSHNLVETGWTCKKLTYSETTTAFTYSYKQLGVQMTSTGIYSVPLSTRSAFAVQLQNAQSLGADSMGRVNQFVVAGAPLEYMIIRACTFFPAVPGLLSFTIEYVYVLTRLQVPIAATTTAIATAATAAGIGSGVLQAVVQTGC